MISLFESIIILNEYKPLCFRASKHEMLETYRSAVIPNAALCQPEEKVQDSVHYVILFCPLGAVRVPLHIMSTRVHNDFAVTAVLQSCTWQRDLHTWCVPH